MKGLIHKLSDDLINKIAAGEVIQRPSSVLKELIENSVDANANNIDVVVKDFGKSLIEISDDGDGMNKNDLCLCFLKHTTSKIKSSSDLFSLTSKGFRGEAISSISSVSKITISSSNNKNGIRNIISVVDNSIVDKKEESGLNGTRISVRNLFYNLPARRKFLKSDNVELRHIIIEFTRQSLCHPEISFSLRHNDNYLYKLKKSNLKERVIRLFTNSINKKLVPIDENTDIVKIKGYVFKPEYLNKSRSMQYFFVNGRYVKNNYLNHSIMTSYEGLIKPESRPSYILFIDVPTQTIDVNVHPNKIEVKFENESSLYAILRSCIRHSLGKFNVAPNIDFSNNINISSPILHSKSLKVPKVDFDNNYDPFNENENKENIEKSELNIQNWNSSKEIFSEKDLQDSTHYSNFNFLKKFIVTKTKSELLIVDIKKAYQRVLYERILSEINNKKNVSQTLIFPINLSYSNIDFQVLLKLKDILSHLGFIFEKFNLNEIEITGVHPVFNCNMVNDFFNELIENDILNYSDHSTSVNDYLAKLICISKSLNLNHLENEKEQTLLLNQLFACKDSMVTPLGKKIYISIEDNDIKKRFI